MAQHPQRRTGAACSSHCLWVVLATWHIQGPMWTLKYAVLTNLGWSFTHITHGRDHDLEMRVLSQSACICSPCTKYQCVQGFILTCTVFSCVWLSSINLERQQIWPCTYTLSCQARKMTLISTMDKILNILEVWHTSNLLRFILPGSIADEAFLWRKGYSSLSFQG